MALKVVWQLQKLVVSYCDISGSSRGIRAFMESHLPAFKEGNPQLEVLAELNRGHHPYLKAFYRNNKERVVCVKKPRNRRNTAAGDEVEECIRE